MSIKTLILDRLARRKGADSHILPLEGQRKALRGLVEDTILPRQIIVSGAGKNLVLRVAESRVFSLSCHMDELEVLAIDFAQTPLSSALKAEVSEALGNFLTPAEAFSVDYAAFERPAEKGHALRADTLLTPSQKPHPLGLIIRRRRSLLTRLRNVSCKKPPPICKIAGLLLLAARARPWKGCTKNCLPR